MTRVLIVDDEETIRLALRKFLRSRGYEVEIAGSGDQALQFLDKDSFSLMLCDVRMPGMDGIEATRRTTDAAPGVRVVMLTSFAEPQHVNAALDAGAVGYLLKDAESDEIARAIRAAYRGEAPFSSRAAGALLMRRAQHRPGEDLTPREREILDLVGQGLANKQISRRLNIKEKTVKAHLTNVFQRIGVSDRTSAALWAARHLH